MKRVIEYITNPAKTEPHLIGGLSCDINNAYNQFVMTKRHYQKEAGRQYIHFMQSFAPYEKITPEEVKSMADELVKMKQFEGYEIIYATHIDRAHLHTHFILNTVNAVTGLKWKQGATELQMIKDYSDELCRKRGLTITVGKKGNYKKRGEYRAKIKAQSWKHELYLAVKEVKRLSKSKDDFISNMNKLGYKVNWTDTRKHITFVTPDGKKCRNNKLYPPEKFTKESLLKTFELNTSRASDEVDIENSTNCSINSTVENVKEYIVAYEKAEELELEGLRTGYRKIIEHNNYILAMKEMGQGNGYEFVTWMYSYDKKGVTIGRYFNDYESAKENMAIRSGLIDRNKMFNETELKLIHTNLINYVALNPNIEYRIEEAIGSVLDKIENIIPEILARDELEELELVDDDGLEL